MDNRKQTCRILRQFTPNRLKEGYSNVCLAVISLLRASSSEPAWTPIIQTPPLGAGSGSQPRSVTE
jgi:hypothetical protein